jgi:thiol:disulfide interchange protein
MLRIVIFLLLFASFNLSSQVLKPVKWEITKEKITESEYYLIFKAQISKGWTVYSQYTSDEGPVPTAITYEDKSGIELIGKSTEFGYKKEGPDPLFDNVNVIKFLDKEPFVIKQKVKIKDANKTVKGYLTYMTCDNAKCLPPDDIDFSIGFDPNPAINNPEKKNIEVIDATSENQSGVSTKNPTTENGNIGATNLKTQGQLNTDTALSSNSIIDSATLLTNNHAFKSTAKIQNGIIDQLISGLFSTYKVPKGNCGSEVKSSGLLWTFLGGFSGGLFAILTPCVFPMIPITVSYFIKDSKRKGWVNGLLYGLSIIFIYVTLGLLITIIFGPEALNNLSVNWVANVIFFLIFIFFAFSFFGYYELTLPSSWSTKSDKMADKGGLLGIFFMAATLAIVSFSCTGPIIGTALVSAGAKGAYLGPFVIMLGFSLALALPFGLFAIFPSWLSSLPKSGGWLNSVKVVLGFMELGFALKFLSTADLTMHWGTLKYEIFMGIWLVLAVLCVFYLLGFIKFPHDSPLKKYSPSRIGFVTLFSIISIYIALGFRVNNETQTYKTPSLLSGIVPPAGYNLFLDGLQADQSLTAKYPSFGKCANGIDCFKNYYEGLSYARETGKPLFIDSTGHGCQNCRKTEDMIWSDEVIRKKLNDDFVLVSLYVDDKKPLPETLISKARGNKIRNIGNLWADFQIVNFEQNSQPLYVVVDPKTETVLTKPRGYEEGIADYNKYMDCGMNTFKGN